MEACPYRTFFLIGKPITAVYKSPRRGGPLYPPARIALNTHPEIINKSLHGQASRPARTENRSLASVAATADTNADERSATGQRQGEGAGLGRDIGAGIGNLDVASGVIAQG